MDKEFIEKNHLSEAVKRFNDIAEYKSPKQSLKNLYEYTFITAPQINEDGEEENTPDNQQQPTDAQSGMGQQPMDNGQGMDMQQPQADNTMGGDPNMDSNGDGGADTGADMSGAMDNQNNMGEEDPNMEDFDEPQTEDDVETEEMEADDEVIDVDDLTQSQEATEYKIDGVDDRLAKIYALAQKFANQLEKNEESINALKTEFEKRNPTEEERLNIRSQSSYPYSETPNGYWAEKMKENPHYDVMYDNEVAPSEEEKKFEIKKSDIDGLNMKEIADSLDIDQNLNDYLKF
jgi:hypothetical protein